MLTPTNWRAPPQSKLKREAAAGAIEEQLSAKEAVKADNAASLAKVAENEAQIRSLREKTRELQAAHDAQARTKPFKSKHKPYCDWRPSSRFGLSGPVFPN